MPRQTSARRISEIERRILRALCHGADAGAASEWPCPELKNYRWHEPEHRVVYEALAAAPRRGGRRLRESLPAQAARLGFPDVDWAAYFDSPGPDEEELPELLRDLKAALREHTSTERPCDSAD